MRSFWIIICGAVLFSGIVGAQSLQDLERLKREYEQSLGTARGTETIREVIESETPRFEELEQKPIIIQQTEAQTPSTLPYFGYDFFTAGGSVAFWENMPVPPDYRLGPGDEIIISLWGDAQLRSDFIVNRDGNIYVDKVGLLSLSGKTLVEARDYLTRHFEQAYSTLRNPRPTTFMDVTLGKLKSINVKFLGEVKLPSILPIHPFSTVTTGLIQAGGVNKTGTLRKMQIIRDGKLISTVDMYAFLLEGRTDGDVRLKDQDVVFVPVRESTITVKGSVQRPGIYEALTDDSFAEMIGNAGGYKPETQAQLVVRRTIPLERRQSEDNAIETFYVAHQDLEKYQLQDGDIVELTPIHSVQRTVSIIGQVKSPGTYTYKDSMRVSDLLDLGGGLNDESYWKSIYKARAEVLRRDEAGDYVVIMPLDLQKLKDGDQSQNMLLQNLDQLVVRENPFFDSPKNVTLTGEIAVPGVYSITSDDENLEQIFARAGGFTERAFEEGIDMTRNDRRVILRDYSILVENGDKIYIPEYPGVVMVAGEVYNSGYIHFVKGQSLSDYIESAGGFTDDAKKSNVSIAYANGDVKVKKLLSAPKVAEGATIIVHRKEERDPFDLTTFLTNVASITASLATVIFIIASRTP
ncbi:SLBB domain-containing protein [Candidatus Neomarinimicrobiota bacterium]